jgi:RNA polymerase sigma-70 factor (ECF subfamily)
MAELLPTESDVHALAALVRYSEARRAARTDAEGCMVALADQDPRNWDATLIADANSYFSAAKSAGARSARFLQAELQRTWCARQSISCAPPWAAILRIYDELLLVRDDAVVRINRAVAVAEVAGPDSALQELEQLAVDSLQEFAPYHATRADLLRRVGRLTEARHAYERVLALGPAPAEERWIKRRLAGLSV